MEKLLKKAIGDAQRPFFSKRERCFTSLTQVLVANRTDQCELEIFRGLPETKGQKESHLFGFLTFSTNIVMRPNDIRNNGRILLFMSNHMSVYFTTRHSQRFPGE
jgi:hypothetical protein